MRVNLLKNILNLETKERVLAGKDINDGKPGTKAVIIQVAIVQTATHDLHKKPLMIS